MTQFAVHIALVICIIAIARRGVEFAFLHVWIPFFLAMPFSFQVGFPVHYINFMQSAIVPILAVLVIDRMSRGLLRFGLMEAMLAAYILLRVYADFTSRGYSDAQNYLFYMLTSMAGPYLIGRYLITDRRMDVATARAFVAMFVLFFPLFLYEAKFWVSPIFKIFSPLFPDSFSGLSVRWGLARTAGTFEHPILACIMIIVTYRLHRWLCWAGEWERPQAGVLGWLQARCKPLKLRLAHVISAILVLMALMTISRGPWIGGIAAGFLVAVGNLRDRKRGLWIVALGMVVAGLLGQLALDAYITPEQGAALTGEAQTMLYRKVMVERYKEFLMERMWWGWGLTTVPKIQGLESVDNAFFLMALQHGVFAPAIFVVMFLYAIGTQLRSGLKAPAGIAPLGFTFSGVYLMCFVAFATVYMGAQTEPMLFLLLGWGESVKARGEPAAADPGESGAAATTGPKPPFRHVMR